ncbi:MAG: hypothetical protein IPM29_12890 [Planctomycetes bacterium]|nr:hypothetical protein [Planctomycetota bacterium]
MNRFRPSLIAIAPWAVTVLAATAAAQHPQRSMIVDHAPDRFVLVQRADDVLLGMGARYTARFHTDRVEVAPATSRPHTVALRSRAAARGAAPEPLARTTPPREDGLRVRYGRGAITETYDVRADGLELGYVFAELPAGDGDLTVTIDVDSSLPLAAVAADAIEFGDDSGAVRIAGVLGIDALGNRAAGSMEYARHVLTLRLPAAFVAHAALPLVLDPLITATTPLGVTPGNSLEAAYDATTDRCLIVWQQPGGTSGTSPMEIRGWFEPGGAVLLDSAGSAGSPVVGNCNARDCFVVAWPETGGIVARAVASPTTLGSLKALTNATGSSWPHLAISTNASPTADRMVIVATEAPASGPASCRVLATRVSASLDLAAAATTTVSGSGGLYTGVGPVAIAKSGGANGRYLVAWSQGFGGTPTAFMGLCTDTGALASTVVSRPAPGNDLTEIVADGQDGQWVVGLRSSPGAFPTPGFAGRLHLLGVGLDGAGNPTPRDPVQITDDSGGGLLNLALAGRRVVASYAVPLQVRCTSSDPQCTSSRIASFTLTGCLPCQAAEEFYWTGTHAALVRPSASGNVDPQRAEEVVAFAVTGTLATHSSQGSRLTLDNRVGLVTDLGGGCGGLTARVYAECAKTGGTHQAVVKSVNGTCWLVIGTDRIDMRGCGTCVLVPDPYTSFVVGPLRTDRNGDASWQLAVPATPGLVGVRLYEQWLVSGPGLQGCASFPFALSNALQVQIQ